MLQQVTIEVQREAKGSVDLKKWGGAKSDGVVGGLPALKGGGLLATSLGIHFVPGPPRNVLYVDANFRIDF